ncbi:hypothetical protein H4R33_005941 [Dimargaris cristalligena]|nr:hypothetical protein H4R33_005941 [Dimargaris cristalligena]
MRDKILVLGPPGVPKQAIVEWIVQSSPNVSGPSAEQSSTDEPSSLPEELLVVPWWMNTKYYTAQVDFWLDTVPLPTGGAASSALRDTNRGDAQADSDNNDQAIPALAHIITEFDQVGDVVDGFIYVFDPRRPDTFDALKPWAAFCQRHDISVCLALAITVDSLTQESAGLNDVDSFGDFQSHGEVPPAEPDLEAYEDWCIENGFELVAVPELPSIHTAVAYADDGIGRVIEALQSHTWATMVKKYAPPASTTARASAGDPSASGTVGQIKPWETRRPLNAMDALGDLLDGGSSDMEQVLARLKDLRTQAEGMDMERRQEFAAKMVEVLMSRSPLDDNNSGEESD